MGIAEEELRGPVVSRTYIVGVGLAGVEFLGRAEVAQLDQVGVLVN